MWHIRMVRRGILFGLVLAVGTVSATASYRADRSSEGTYRAPEPSRLSARVETVGYDLGPLSAIPISDTTARYWAVQFSPDSLCSLKAGVTGVFVSGGSPFCTLFVWLDSSGVPREQPLFQAGFTSVGLDQWNDITVDPPLVGSLKFWVGYYLPNAGLDPVDQDLAGADTHPSPVTSYTSTDRVNWDPVPSTFPGFHNLAVRAVVSYFPPSGHDVECTKLIGLPDSVLCGSGKLLSAEVYNAGNSSETFDVILEIDTSASLIHIDTQRVVGQKQTEYDTAYFDTFWVPLLDSLDYGILVYTSLAGDGKQENDSVRDSTFGYCIWTDDVEVISLLSPPALALCDSSYDVRARVINRGSLTEIGFWVEAVIESSGVRVYSDTISVDTLKPNDTQEIVFNPWSVPPRDSMLYSVRYTTLLPADCNRSNDTVFGTCSVFCNLVQDVAPVRLVSPGQTVFCDSVYPIVARVLNFGTVAASFDVNCRIDSSGVVVFDSSKTVTDLEPDSVSDIVFSTGWSVPLQDGVHYRVSIGTSLTGDDDTHNDILLDSTTSRCMWIRDVGPVEYFSSDTVLCDSIYEPRVIVHNWGQISETFGVELLIDSGGVAIYSDSTAASGVSPDSDMVVFSFAPWKIPAADSLVYSVRVRTLLIEDIEQSNDTLFDAVRSRCIWRQDIAPVSIVWPGDTVYCDSLGMPSARIANLGQTEETFEVVFSIDTNGTNIYRDTFLVVDLDQGDSIDAAFDTWEVAISDGATYNMAVWTESHTDFSPENDTVTSTSFGICPGAHDVGMVSRLGPPDTVLCAQDYPMWAEVKNYGTFREDLDVVCRVREAGGVGVYADTASVRDLEPDSSFTVFFSHNWKVPGVDSSAYLVTFYIDLARDSDASNDTLTDSVSCYCLPLVERNVGVLAIPALPDTVMCDSTVYLTASVKNFGVRPEFFNVECLIYSEQPVYVDTSAVPGLEPGDSSLIKFRDWRVPHSDTASYTLTIRTLLGADGAKENDSLTRTCFGLCYTFHDVGIVSCVDPPETVFVGSSQVPRVDVCNWGDYTETFEIVCAIGAYSDTQVVSNLDPGWTVPVFFESWYVDSSGSYRMVVKTLRSGDSNTQNDTTSSAIDAVSVLGDEYVLPRVPVESGLLQNVPNPLATYTDIYFQIATPADVTVSVYDLSGRLVKVIFEGQLGIGYHSARWEGNDELGSPVPSGIYVYKMRADKTITSRKLVVVR